MRKIIVIDTIFIVAVMLVMIMMVSLRQMITTQDELKANQQQLEDRINNSSHIEVEKPHKVIGKWQIVLFNAGIIPTKTIKTSCFYVKEKVVWYADPLTGDELPLPEEAMVIPDDGRELEQYGVYKDIQPLYEGR